MKLAARTSRIAPSPTLSINAAVKAMTANGVNIVDFAAGELASDSPDYVKAAAESAIRAGFTRYTATSGIPELKEAIVDKLRNDQGLHYKPSQVLVSCGAKQSLYNLAQALFESGDEVIIPVPYWVSYPDQIQLADANPIFLPTNESRAYAIETDALKRCISPRTKAIILNSPCNPTGAVYDRQTLEGVAELVLRHDLTVISDEIYEKILYEGRSHISIAALGPEIAARTVVVNGVSKSFAMTGWRIGYAAGPGELISAMENIQSQSTSNPTSISQKAAVAALRGDSSFTQRLASELSQRRQIVVEHLNKIPGITCPMPAGAFYAFPNVKQLLGKTHDKGQITSPRDLVTYLLEEAHVACVPGEPFGSHSHIRLSYTPSIQAILDGLNRMTAAVNRFF